MIRLAALLLLLLPLALPAQPRPLATGLGEEATEADLRLFLGAAGRDATYLDRLATAGEEGDEALDNQLREDLQRYFEAMLAGRAASPEEAGLDSDLVAKGARMLAGNAARQVWEREFVRPGVVIHEEDVAFHYRRNWRDFNTARTANIFRLKLDFPQPLTAEGVEDVRVLARTLRSAALTGGGLEAAIAPMRMRRSEETGRAALPFDSPTLDRQTRDVVFSLRPAEVSQPYETADAIYLFEMLSIEGERFPPLSEVEGEIRPLLVEKFVPQQFDYQLLKLSRRARPINRAGMVATLPEDADLFSVRGFGITLGEFRRIFPEIAGPAEAPRRTAVAESVARFVDSEVVAQELERTGLGGDPEFRRAFEVAEALVKADGVRRARRLEIVPTEAEIDAFLRDRSADIVPQDRLEVWRLALGPRRPEALSPGERQSLTLVNRGTLARMTAQAAQQIEERRQIAGDRVFAQPEPIVDNLPRPEDDRVRVRFDLVGTGEPSRIRADLRVSLDASSLGKFSPAVERADGSVASYYVSAVERAAPLDGASLRERARLLLIEELAREPERSRVEKALKDGSIRLLYP
ncbi:MAG: hypothetical protein SF028_04735 [Candidatus Sumerlaeia bacterium]|nr:hypothetical protein [Candidatus Sumerlaeia bacterium]